MDYNLAKQLKDNSFPVNGDGKFIEGNIEEDETGIITTNSVYIPTLSELIEVCGDRFESLIYDYFEKQFTANGIIVFSNEDELASSFGKTPEEAVAKLWLELNKK